MCTVKEPKFYGKRWSKWKNIKINNAQTLTAVYLFREGLGKVNASVFIPRKQKYKLR